ncbi:ribbon-helix-helix protein, CopG family [Paenibacillus sp. TH7-28]
MVAKKKPGPKTDNPMDTMLRVRVDKITLEKLDDSAKKLNTSRSEIIRKGIHKIHDDLKK